ncbi:hypothetical protein C1I98_27810 [Spongiactinospora gelatinilytica]|uniref:Uncharacterized protein n=1 Tax=Spongiactinospora gelatinilytica TaxID=2666298 RepID=A0A2W2FHL9_9ACTN|nr:hypothetical protein [Spongiactinospora gelatinilytica]PZG35141.1 hypothetical protein C1I98_27810 [Spongiactinospora gelatinilytica]
MTDLPQRAGGAAEEAPAGLDRLAALPVGEHVAVFEEIHAGLERALASADGHEGAAGEVDRREPVPEYPHERGPG